MADVCEDFESEEFDCRKVKVSVLEKARKWASGKIFAMCREFNGWQSEMRRTSGEEEPWYGTGIYMVPIQEGDLGVLALHGRTNFLWRRFDFEAACAILNRVGCIGFHQNPRSGGGVRLIEGDLYNYRKSLVMRDGRPALIDSRDGREDSLWRDDRKSPWDCSTYVVEDVGRSRWIKCTGGCRHSEVVEWQTMGFGGSEAVLGILREWMDPERPPDSQRIRIMAPVHQYEQEYVLAGRIERIEADMDKVTMTIASERMIPTGIYYG